jgi:hypothetical protein
VEKADREIKLQFFKEIQGLLIPHYAQKLRKKYKFKVKLNDYWTNLHKNQVQGHN